MTPSSHRDADHRDADSHPDVAPTPTPDADPTPRADPDAASRIRARATRAHSFNTAAAQYAANRPSYPPALFDTVEELAGRSLTGARVVDVGAGTGIATGLLRARGAHVLAVEPGAGMAAEFRRAVPGTPIVRGDGNALPLADARADFLTYAQSWHWTEPARSVPEALRVLRPGGALALWWNTDALDVPWIAAQARRIERYFGDEQASKRGTGSKEGVAGTRVALAFEGAPHVPDHAHRVVRWSRRVPVDTHLANVTSHSIFLVLGEEGTGAFLAEERAHLLEAFPDGLVEEVYDVLVIVATRS
ncbi:methyltransferase domain-containing protein [Streptomyces sp. NPDC096934]|uniref:class I SAM-dependent methyltransferase n=1 Tax=Streptomyces sp. NPDC096934 TaxID=3155551 RepID=UPI003318A31C